MTSEQSLAIKQAFLTPKIADLVVKLALENINKLYVAS